MIFSFDLSLLTWILLASSLLPVIWLLGVYRPRVAKVGKAAAISPRYAASVDDNLYPPVSVIIYSIGDAEHLQTLIPDIFGQDYPAPLEVIVVNDGKNPEIKDVVTRLKSKHKNLYITFTPIDSRNLSRKKLALTLGIKAARNQVVVLTDDACAPASDWWLRLITAPFAESETELVIGHAYPHDTASGATARRFTSGCDAVEFLSAAIRRKTFRATGHNLAYRRDLFFRNKGFSRSLNLHDGDDDIFINQVATTRNTDVAISRGAQMAVTRPNPAQAHRQEQTRRAFTARFLRKGTRRIFGISSAAMWTWLALAIASCLTGWPDMTPIAAQLLMAIALWLPLTITWKRTLSALSCPVSAASIPMRLLWRPFTSLYFKLKARRHKSDHYTWKN